MQGLEVKEFFHRKKISKCVTQLKFLRRCIEEQVLPKSAPKQLRSELVPFSESARMYLEEACEVLSYKIIEFKEQCRPFCLSRRQHEKLDNFTESQVNRFQRKLEELCDESEWKNAGKPGIVNNLSSKQLSKSEKEALSLGLKFDTGIKKYNYVEQVCRNYRWTDEDTEKDFIQGVIACCLAAADQQPNALPSRYISALKNLGEDKDLVITQADKGGGIVVMDKTDYDKKMLDLLEDEILTKNKIADSQKERRWNLIRQRGAS
ncbi:uncharacterized protein LOC143027405 [Oratosquilla oratoria]|uniref:uncharacterized protein LOC143027405 n=1 Tax=Oratosquilla oratoria TaxID=337810 RepID=UPI003F773590